MSNLGAKQAVWIVKEARPEHQNAVEWLNQLLPADTNIYLVRVQALRVGDSAPAALFTLLAGPSAAGKQVGAAKKEVAETNMLRFNFWTALTEKYQNRGDFFANVSPNYTSWISTGSGKATLLYVNTITLDHSRIEFQFYGNTPEKNKEYFDMIAARKDEIERAFGAKLDWYRMDDMITSKILYTLPGPGLRMAEEWDNIQNQLVETSYRFRAAMQPFVDAL